MPIDTESKDGGIDADAMYENMMHKFRYGNISDPKVYLDENTMRMCRTSRMMFSQLVNALVEEGDFERAEKALDYSLEVIPPTTVSHDYSSSSLAVAYYKLDKAEKANEILHTIAQDCVDNLNWYFNLKPAQLNSVENRVGYNFGVLNHVLSLAEDYGQQSFIEDYMEEYQKFVKRIRM